MGAFATVDDLAAFWREMDADEERRAGVLIGYAAAKIRSNMGQAGVDISASDGDQADLLRYVSLSMVQRAMAQGDGQEQNAWGGNIVMNPSGDLYLSASERRDLGIDRMRIGSLSPSAGDDGGW